MATATEYRRLGIKTLMARKFLRNRAAVVSGLVLFVLYGTTIFAEFFSPYPYTKSFPDHLYAPPQAVRIMDKDGKFRAPFVYRIQGRRNPETFLIEYKEDFSQRDTLRLFYRGEPYRLGFLETDLRLLGVEGGTVFLLGTDQRGRDQWSRILQGSRVSLSIGLFGVLLMVVLGAVLGTVSGYYGGAVDNAIQRSIELIRSFPQLPLWMALTAAIPPTWPSDLVYLGITAILALIGWTGLAREVRGKTLALRSTDFILAVEAMGAGTPRIVFKHLLPNVASHIIVTATLQIPILIIGESALSFLGLGIKAPLTSWGLLLAEAQKVEVLRLYPWMLAPGLFIFVSVLAFNFFGDGLRDAVDPYS